MSELPKFIGGLFQLLQNAMTHKPAFVAVPYVKPPCPNCGTSLKDISVMNKMGCGVCYSYYYQEILFVLARAHNAIKHVGKIPASFLDLPKELAEAIKTENYEKAAEIKKKLDF